MHFQFVALLFQAILVSLSAAKTTLGASPQENEKKTPRLRWDPPHIDARLQLQPAPPCSLPDVLNQAGQRTQELVDHLQNFIAHEQVPFLSRIVSAISNLD
jgi:hypothetical protein